MGRPTLCMACLPISLSAGIEVQSGQYKMSLLALKNIKVKENAEARSAESKAPLLKANV
jgi:hypothetical protein